MLTHDADESSFFGNKLFAEVIAKELCVGCGACISACTAEALSFTQDSCGYYIPTLDEDACTSCKTCEKTCPVLSSPQSLLSSDAAKRCYAVLAKSQELLDGSSSGAVFSLLAAHILAQGGSIAGAAWQDDFSVRHILIDNGADLSKLRKSKYLQSYSGDIYQQVKERLETGAPVLFSGTPCQAAGLRSYLERDYKNLIIVDLLCGNAPSTMFFQKYLDEVFGKEKVFSYEFRHKKQGWNGDCVAVTLAESAVVVRRGGKEDEYQSLYHDHTLCPRHCDKCLFAGVPRFGDVTIGDFWGVKLPTEITKKGVSVVIPNTPRGKTLFSAIQTNCSFVQEFPLPALGGNGLLNNGGINFVSAHRDKFHNAIRYMPFKKIDDALKIRHFDIGMYGWWDHENFGSILTYFALHQLLTKLGYSILMIHEALGATPHRYKMPQHSLSIDFANRYYVCSLQRTFDELPIYNQYCDTFIVGGDQMWNNHIGFVASDNFLSFVGDDKRKLSYSTSFGAKNKKVPPEFLETNGHHLRRFTAVSVREDYAVEIAKQDFGVEAERVLDAVFMLDSEDYNMLIRRADLKVSSDYLVAFILDATEEKRRVVTSIAQRLGLEIIVIPDAAHLKQDQCRTVFCGYRILDPLTIENFLFAYKNASYVVTDSFHGSCFSYIFRKNFSVFYNEKRGSDRFVSLFKLLDIEDRRIYESMTDEEIKQSQTIGTLINFSQAEENVNFERKRSLEWLKDVLQR
jgi:coenzyme F420-reducing hydrogenase beta subunit